MNKNVSEVDLLPVAIEMENAANDVAGVCKLKTSSFSAYLSTPAHTTVVRTQL